MLFFCFLPNRITSEDPMKLVNIIQQRFKQEGWQVKIVSVEHLPELQKNIEAGRIEGRLDPVLYTEYLDRFDFNLLRSVPDIKSIIIATVPQFKVKVSFKRTDQTHACIIPPTYCLTTDDRVKELLENIMVPEGYRLLKTRLPQKLLAVHSGLAKYGRNNLAYVSGMGSFHRPVVFSTDMPFLEDGWEEASQLMACENCSACRDACPTGAIGSDRFLIHAERCITFHNERTPEYPKWLDPAWHNCWVGCMLCQGACPINQKFLNRVEDGAAFSEVETDYLLKTLPPGSMPKSLTDKIENLGIKEYADVLGRNLKTILKYTA